MITELLSSPRMQSGLRKIDTEVITIIMMMMMIVMMMDDSDDGDDTSDTLGNAKLAYY